MKKIRTRFAPSPTGYIHIGSLRTALYNWLFSKKNNGDFILRVEDTDRTRFVEKSIENLIKTLEFVGLNYDEGVFLDKSKKLCQKGDFGPYIQSERLEMYKKYAVELINKNLAYYCFCSEERLNKIRKVQKKRKIATMYDGKCGNLKKQEIKDFIKKNTPYVVRMRIPKNGFTEFEDLVYGKIKIKNEKIDDQVLIKSDGYPTYHLANVVDDHLMKISYVIRGEEWLSSVPKHILLYKYFEWEIPKFAHLPLILNQDKSKLSKRQGDVSVESYLKKGYLPKALLNFILFLGWNPKTEEEIFSTDEMIKKFNLSGINKHGAIFNTQKLDWINGFYIRKMNIIELTKLCEPYLKNCGLISKIDDGKYRIENTGKIVDFEYIMKTVELEQKRMNRLCDIKELVKFIFVDELEYEKDLLVWKKMSFDKVKENLCLIYDELQKISEMNFNKDNLKNVLIKFIEKNGLSKGEALWPLRVSLTGLGGSPGPFEVADVLGKKAVLKRIRYAIGKLD